MTADPLAAITAALEQCRTLVPAEQARAVLAALQSAYVPPPPGSDRDKLPDHLLVRIDIPPYLSTYCQTAKAIEDAIRRGDPDQQLGVWAGRMHHSCRITRKQDMAPCRCPCHQVRGTE